MKNKNFRDLKIFNDCCVALGFTEQDFNYRYEDLGLSNYLLATAKGEIINKAINGDWVPDWNNSNQRKYYPYFRMGSAGFGFSVTLCIYYGTDSCVGSRLCFETSEQAEYAGKQFLDIYKQIYLIEHKEPSLLEQYKNSSDNGLYNKELVNKITKNFDYKTIKSFEDACKKLGISTKITVNSGLPEMNKTNIALYKLMVIYKAINNGWEANWDNSNQRKYYPWFYMGSGGFGFSAAHYGCNAAGSTVGSRLCTYSSEVALYIGKQFEELYLDWFVVDNNYDKIVVTTDDIEEIYQIACATWKTKIIEITNKYKDKNPFKNKVYLPNEVIDEMFKAATDEQKPVLNKIFKR